MGKTPDQVTNSRTSSSSEELSTRRRKGRAVNAIADYLRSHLRVPNVYLAPSGMSRVDVLAADAAGSGDIHAVSVEMLTNPIGTKTFSLYIETIKKLPAHYKYLAIPEGITNVEHDPRLLFSADGIGRFGIFQISESVNLSLRVELIVKPERFRMQSDDLARVERYLNNTKPDMSVRV